MRIFVNGDFCLSGARRKTQDTSQDNMKQYETRGNEKRYGMRRPDETRRDKTRRDKSRRDETRQDKTICSLCEHNNVSVKLRTLLRIRNWL